MRALAAAAVLGAAAGLLHWLGVGLPMLGAVLVLFALLSLFAPRTGVRLLDSCIGALRSAWWRDEQGRHYSFEGVSLHFEDDGRYLWLDANDWRRVRRVDEANEVLAARHSGRWRYQREGQLQLRLDAVIAGLAGGADRMQPRTVKLRRYLERELMFPAAERRRRAS